MNLTRDLKSKTTMYIKALLFCMILILAVILNLMEIDLTIRILSIVLIVWSSARIYYFMFYVIENYINPKYKFSGIYSLLKYLLTK